AILPLWARRTKSLDALIPVLYLRGISTGDFQEALSALRCIRLRQHGQSFCDARPEVNRFAV
ncbi:hypothetical protein, partial [Bradyrhizobium sp. Mp27]|uniref:hypothetical protein n=1 Tax=Bradyrhizobium sp. Mp27 TaxID=3042157 RepID=UPI00248C074C